MGRERERETERRGHKEEGGGEGGGRYRGESYVALCCPTLPLPPSPNNIRIKKIERETNLSVSPGG